MKKYLIFLIMPFFIFVFIDSSFATTWDWGSNITINDGRQDDGSGGSGWYKGINQGEEDEEVEPDNETGQIWDLEGFFLNDSSLTMVGGYDFVNGEYMYDNGNNTLVSSGDIFIDVDGSYGTTTGNYGYEYVLDMDWSSYNTTTSTISYTVYDLRTGSITLTDVFSGLGNDSSNPWQYSSGGSALTDYTSQTATYETGISDAESGFSGEGVNNVWNGTSYVDEYYAHNAVGVDLSFLSPNELANFTAHFTMECGNDNLMGAVPEPSTLILLGLGLLGLSAVSRKKIHKS